jgi:hypothetical protein
MLEVLVGSHCTVTFLCAASYCLVSWLSVALSAAVIAPVSGGSTALIVTGPLPPPLPVPLPGEPPDEQAAASRPATASAVTADRVLLRTELIFETARDIAKLTSGERGDRR